MTQVPESVLALYRGRKGRVELVDVPALNYFVVTGSGDPTGPAFQAAIQALYTVTYGAHFAVRKQHGTGPKVMPLEALWWVDDPVEHDLLAAVALGVADLGPSDAARWRWQAMIMQPAPIDETYFEQAVLQARKKELPTLDEVRLERWEEGPAAQLVHVGPYAEEGRTIRVLHDAIEAAGYRPRGRHHEIYLGDPRRCAPHRLRTLLRHPIEPA